jgi:hypothetical protein
MILANINQKETHPTFMKVDQSVKMSSHWNKSKNITQNSLAFHTKHCTAVDTILAAYLKTSSRDLDHQDSHSVILYSIIGQIAGLYHLHSLPSHLSFDTTYPQKLTKNVRNKNQNINLFSIQNYYII